MNALADPIHAEVAKALADESPSQSSALQVPLPSNLPAEAAIIGAVMFDNNMLHRVSHLLRAEHFHAEAHQIIWEAIIRLNTAGKVADGVTLRTELAASDAIESVGGASYLGELLDSAAFGPEVVDYGHMIVDLFKRRSVVLAARGAVSDINTNTGTTETVSASLQSALIALDQEGPQAARFQDSQDAALESIDRSADDERHIPTGFAPLDSQIIGLLKGAVTVLAARPSVGKTSLGVAIARNIVAAGDPVLYFSLEMPRYSIGIRDCAYRAYDPDAFKGGFPDNPTYFDIERRTAPERHKDRIRALERQPGLFVDDRGGLRPAQLTSAYMAVCRAAKRKGLSKPAAVVVDHLGHIRPDGGSRGRVEDTGANSKAVLAFAKQHDVAVLQLVQLNRKVEGEQRKPNLADLRWSGEIEEDAHGVLFLHRKSQYLRNDPDRIDEFNACRNDAEIIIGKNRDGPLSTVKLWCDMGSNYFADPKLIRTGNL